MDTTDAAINLNDASQNTAANYANYKGDICQYLSKIGAVSGSWRMPTTREFNPEIYGGGVWSDSKNTVWTPFGSFGSTSCSADGQSTNISSGGTYTVNGVSSRFPASGYRYLTGSLQNVGELGLYWSSSASNVQYGFFLSFDSRSVLPANSYNRQGGFIVRCVRN